MSCMKFMNGARNWKGVAGGIAVMIYASPVWAEWHHAGADYFPIPADLETRLDASNRLALGSSHGVALTSAGVPFAWGAASNGQTTILPGDMTEVAAAAIGAGHTVLLKSDGSVSAFGLNTALQTSVPGSVSSAEAVAAGDFHSLALVDGEVIAWGYSRFAQTVVPAAAKSDVVAIAAGGEHSVALTDEGEVLAWGWNIYGQSTVPAAAKQGVVAIAAGAEHTVALTSGGEVLVWGRNNAGQGTVPVEAQTGVAAIASGASHVIALKDDGSVLAWGSNASGQTDIPTTIVSKVQRIAAGGDVSYYLTGALTIGVESVAGETFVSGESELDAGVVKVDGSGSVSFVLKNDEDLPIQGLAVTLTGSDTGFSGPADLPTQLAGGATQTVTLLFDPTASGEKTATLAISGDSVLNSPFTLKLTGTALSPEEDGDSDGFSDWTEYVLRDLGFDYETDQSDDADELRDAMAEVGLYFEAEIGGVNVAPPVFARDEITGEFSFTLDFQKSSDLQSFTDFPLDSSILTIDGSGNARFSFESGDDKAFYRVKVE